MGVAKRAKKVVVADPQAAIRAEFIKQGSDPVIAKKALEDATSLSRGLWLSFLTFGTYLVITFAGVDHRDLLLETPIMLPVLNAPLPLVTFFWVAPILFLIFHLYLLLSLKLLADQVHHYLGQMEEVGLDQDEQDRARLQLPNFVVVQKLGGTSAQINSWAGRLMRFTAWLTLAAGPIILLLFAQLMFLPYHGWWVTMAQRMTVVIDLVFIWYFWPAIRRPERGGLRLWSSVASAAVVAVSVFVFIYPGERFYGPLPKLVFTETGANPEAYGLEVLYNTLVLPGERLVDDDLYNKLDARNKEKGLQPWDGERSFNLSHRDFRQADFSDIDLRKAQLSGSTLTGANLNRASIRGSFLRDALLQGASLDSASMQGVSFTEAKLQGADLTGATLDGAVLHTASLQGVYFVGASLRGATLANSHMQGATINAAWLHGASLDQAKLQGASFDLASLEGASLRYSQVWRNEGNPDLTRTDLANVVVAPISLVTYESILLEALEGVPEKGKSEVESRISVIDPRQEFVGQAIDWTEAKAHFALRPDSQDRIITSLILAACDVRGSPYVAQGIVIARFSYILDEFGERALPFVDQLLEGCPGTVGMDQGTIDKLKALKEEFAPAISGPRNSKGN